MLPPDHPIFSEGPSITFVSDAPTRRALPIAPDTTIEASKRRTASQQTGSPKDKEVTTAAPTSSPEQIEGLNRGGNHREAAEAGGNGKQAGISRKR